MPTPIIIRDPNPSDKRIDPASVVGRGLVSPAIRGLISTENASSPRSHATTRMGDISTSPRLLGYVFSFMSSAVALASSVMFYVRGVYPADFESLQNVAKENNINITTDKMNMLTERYNELDFSGQLFLSSGGIMTRDYQVYGSIFMSGLITVISGCVLFAHLDSFCCPNYSRRFFRDGSASERSLILSLIMLSAVSLQISTSRFSVGEAQINVYFSTWVNFLSCALNFEVWRNGAGRHFSFQNVLFDREFPMKRHWFFMAIFTTIAFLSMIDYLINGSLATDNAADNAFDWDCLRLSWNNKWLWMALSLTILSWGAFFMRRIVEASKFVQHVFELVIISSQIAICGYVIVNLTGGRLDQISCPSNLYFSIWAAFFTAIWIFSSLLQTK